MHPAISNNIQSELVADFIYYLQAKQKTAETYTRALKVFFQYLGKQNIVQPARADIVAYTQHLKARQHKPATIQSYLVAVKRFFSWLADEGLYQNIAANVKSGVKQDRAFKKDALTSAQVKEVMQAIDRSTLTGARDYALFALMLTAGLRTIELIRANIGDMRTLGESTVLFIQGKGKDGKSEYVKIAAQVETAIRSYLSERGKAEVNSPLFASASNNNNGQRMTTRAISGIVKARLMAAGYNSEFMTAHSLRHTAATINLLNGATLEETQQLLRHSNINTTLIYAHHLERMKNDSEQRIATAIFL